MGSFVLASYAPIYVQTLRAEIERMHQDRDRLGNVTSESGSDIIRNRGGGECLLICGSSLAPFRFGIDPL